MNKIRELRKAKKVSMKELGQAIGGYAESTISLYENNKRQPDQATLIKLADFFGVSVDYLLGREPSEEDKRIQSIGGFNVPDKYLIPIVGQVVAGKPVESPENIEGYVYIEHKNAQDYFALRVSGDSMINAGIVPGSLLIVHKQNTANNGDIIVASVDGESTVKRYKENAGAVFLMPENSAYNPILITEKTAFYIFGKVVEVRVSL